MIHDTKTFSLPPEIWVEIARKHPAACLALSGVSKPINEAIASQTKLVSTIARSGYQTKLDDIAFIKGYPALELQSAKEEVKWAKENLVGGLPIVAEVQRARRRKANGISDNPFDQIPIAILHLALSPLTIPLQAPRKIRYLVETRRALRRKLDKKATAAEQDCMKGNLNRERMALCNAIAKDPRWTSGAKY